MSEPRASRDWDVAPFECAPGLRLRAHEQLSKVQLDALSRRLEKLDQLVERLEKRLWLAVYGVVGFVLIRGVLSIFEMANR